jgi:hypothetical protein
MLDKAKLMSELFFDVAHDLCTGGSHKFSVQPSLSSVCHRKVIIDAGLVSAKCLPQVCCRCEGRCLVLAHYIVCIIWRCPVNAIFFRAGGALKSKLHETDSEREEVMLQMRDIS